jgi:hypothetical protein
LTLIIKCVLTIVFDSITFLKFSIGIPARCRRVLSCLRLLFFLFRFIYCRMSFALKLQVFYLTEIERDDTAAAPFQRQPLFLYTPGARHRAMKHLSHINVSSEIPLPK